ncbi:hypothetical protein KsCSTR_31060 [Candidatus Kuenenia stuttgartiensis]|jgi:wyosine [tRNA(Phe)-imidazoG37] synthetase (radical SAM superfamily)|nr:hypothetical protein [Candidatus Kuenenia stuttgartiensis]MBE7547073.1 hypothetical protein [Planctomycetia bacterium]QII12485.1 hypothetical protein KsCSTR_31060 [Candidatus Kuenenia stuttgartiensis]
MRRLVKRREFYKPDVILKEADEKIEKLRESGESIDYLTFVPDGEPPWMSILVWRLKR